MLLLMAVLVGFGALLGSPGEPLMTITSTVFPSCRRQHYVVTPTSLTVRSDERTLLGIPLHGRLTRLFPRVLQQERVIFEKRLSPHSAIPLLSAISNVPLRTLDPFYDDPSTQDGFQLRFHFYDCANGGEIVLQNRYVPELYRVLDEINRLLPTARQLRFRQQFVSHNKSIERLIARFSEDNRYPANRKAKIIAGLKERIVVLDGPQTSTNSSRVTAHARDSKRPESSALPHPGPLR